MLRKQRSAPLRRPSRRRSAPTKLESTPRTKLPKILQHECVERRELSTPPFLNVPSAGVELSPRPGPSLILEALEPRGRSVGRCVYRCENGCYLLRLLILECSCLKNQYG